MTNYNDDDYNNISLVYVEMLFGKKTKIFTYKNIAKLLNINWKGD